MKSKLKSWPEFHNRINLVYHGVIAISLIPFALVFLDIDTGNDANAQVKGNSALYLGFVFLVSIFITCYRVWKGVKEKLQIIDKDWGIKKKLIVYFNFQIKRYMQLEVGALISLAGLWLTASYVFVITYLLVLVQFSLLRPSQDKVIRDLGFTKEERERLRGEEL